MKTEPQNVAQLYFDSAEVFMIAINNDEIVTDINKKGCDILGIKKNEIIGKKWFDNFLPENTKENMKRVFHKMLQGTPRHVHYEHSVITKQGSERTINWHNILTSDQTGNTTGILSSGDDVTERKKAEEPRIQIENRLQATLESMLEGCQIIDYDWRYAYINESAAKQGRRTKKELIGHTMPEIYPGIDNTQLFTHLKNCMDKRVAQQIENEFTFPDGSKGWFELRVEPAPEGILILSSDITKRKEIEEELKNYRKRLEEVVAERTAEYAKANEKLTQEIDERGKIEEGLKLRATILDNASEAILLLNLKGDFAYTNEAASKTYGYNHDEFLNMNLRHILQPEEASIVESRLLETIQKGHLDLETVHLRKDKTPIHVKVRHNLIKTAHGQFIVSVIRETTA
jgi:PAS domain S-box-containing protein